MQFAVQRSIERLPSRDPQLANDLIDASLATATHRNYQSALARFHDWLGDRETSDESIAEYIAHIHACGRSVSVARMFVSALRFFARWHGLADPIGKRANFALRGFSRTAMDRGRGQVSSLGWDDMERICESLGDTNQELRDTAIMGIMSDGLLRISEVSAIDCQDLKRQSDGSGRLTIVSSKTDQEGIGVVVYIGAPTMQKVQRWKQAVNIEHGKLFRPLRKNGAIAGDLLGSRSVGDMLKKRARDIGIEGVAGHSLRIGSTEDLVQAGASLVELQLAGRWSSPKMPAYYARSHLASQGAVAKFKYGKKETRD